MPFRKNQLIYLLFFFLVVIAKRDLTTVGAQSGTASLLYMNYTTPQYPYPHFASTYSEPFKSIPNVIVAFHTLKNCPSLPYQYIILYAYEVSRTNNYFEWNGILSQLSYFDHSFILKGNYFAYDPTVMTNIQSHISQPVIQNALNQYTVTFSNVINDPSTSIACFLLYLWRENITLSPYNMTINCNALNTNTVKFLYHTTALKVIGVSAVSVRASIIVFLQSPLKMILQIGSILDTPSSYPTVPLDPNQKSTAYFIGLTGFKSPDSCLYIRLNANNINTHTSSTFIQASFTYFQVFYKILVLMQFKSYPYLGKIQYVFQNFTDYSPTPLTTFDAASIVFSSFSSNTLEAKIIGSTPSSATQVTLAFSRGAKILQTKFKLKITTVSKATIKVLQNRAQIIVLNIDSFTNLQNFQFSTQYAVYESLSLDSSKGTLKTKFQKQIIGIPFNIYYHRPDGYDTVLIEFAIPTITSLATSASSTFCFSIIEGIPNTTATTHTLFSQGSSNFMNINAQIADPNNKIKMRFNYLRLAQTSPIQIIYTPGSPVSFRAHFEMKLVTVKSIEVVVNSNICKIIFINIPKQNKIQITDFSTTDNQLQLVGISQINNQTNIEVKYEKRNITNIFQAIFSPNGIPFVATTTDLKIVQRFIKFQVDIFAHQLNITLENVEMVSILPSLSLFHGGGISLTGYQILGNIIVISTQYNKTLDGSFLSLNLDFDVSTIYYDVVTINFTDDPPVIYCVDRFQDLKNAYKYTGYSIVVMYWIVFIISLFFCQKIYGIQLMFLLQFAYISLIPSAVYCPPFNAFESFKYAFGYNGINLPVQQNFINLNYRVLGFHSNFISNVNIMLFPLPFCPVIYIVLKKLGNKSTNYITKPRLLKCGSNFLFEIPFTIILLNASNICTSFVVNIQAFNVSNIFSLAISIFAALLVLTSAILFVFFRNNFEEYKSQFCCRLQMCGISIQKSTNIRRMYPLLLLFQITTISTILSIQSFFEYSLYCSLVIIVLVTGIILVSCPYNYNVDNYRLFVYRFFLITICCLQIGFKLLRNDYAPLASIVYVYPWFFMIVLLLAFLGVQLPYIIYKCVKWVKTRSSIDLDLYNKQHPFISRPYYPVNPQGPSLLYPALQFSRYNRRQERERMMVDDETQRKQQNEQQ